jgi:hypothetical protein
MRLSRFSLVVALPLATGLGLMTMPARAFDHSHGQYARVLERFVSNGRVDYAGLKTNATGLRAYLEEVATVSSADFKAWTPPQQLAFLLNTYNAATLQLVIENYRVASIRKIGGLFKSPWSLPVVRLWGDTHSLDWLEHEIIRPSYPEPRIHFALVCAAKGCPPLRAEPYAGARLEEQLQEQARIFLQQTDKNHLDAAAKTLHLSPIFKWYGTDFTANGKSLADYVRPYLSPADAALLTAPGWRVAFTKYDWSLNDTRTAN